MSLPEGEVTCLSARPRKGIKQIVEESFLHMSEYVCSQLMQPIFTFLVTLTVELIAEGHQNTSLSLPRKGSQSKKIYNSVVLFRYTYRWGRLGEGVQG